MAKKPKLKGTKKAKDKGLSHDGSLKTGYRHAKGGRVVKIKRK
jgi:hypothetical protein